MTKKYREKCVFFVDFKSSLAHLTFIMTDFPQKMVYIYLNYGIHIKMNIRILFDLDF